jgi:hypothetical protein
VVQSVNPPEIKIAEADKRAAVTLLAAFADLPGLEPGLPLPKREASLGRRTERVLILL